MPRKAAWPPRVRTRRGRDYIRIRLAPGQWAERWLGPAGSEQSRREYLRVVAEVEAMGTPRLSRSDVTLAELAADYLRDRCGQVDARQYARIVTALRPALDLYGRTPAVEFGPVALRTVREQYVQGGYCRRLANQMVGCVRTWFRWAAAREMIAHETADRLAHLEPLHRGQTAAVDHPDIPPADPEMIDVATPLMGRVVRDMVRLQQSTGLRPGEVCLLRPIDLDRPWRTIDGVEVWLYRIDKHKTDWRGHRRLVAIGPRAQAILSPWLGCQPDAYCFSPRLTARNTHARTRSAGEHYTTGSYDRAVRRACLRAGIPPWTPNQIRHLVGTQVEVEYGREDARCVLGHRSPTTTQIYAESVERAARVAAVIG